MKILSVSLLLMATIAFVLIGCSDDSGTVVPPNDGAVSTPGAPAGFAKSGPGVHSVSGNVHVFVQTTNGTSDKHWSVFSNMSMNAVLGQGNIVSGTIKSCYIGTPLPGSFPEFSGKMIQLIVEENPEVGRMAKVMFEVTKGVELFPPEFGPTPVGCLVIVDGGEGTNALPDCISSLVAIDSPETMQSYGFYDLTPGGYIEGIIPILPYFGLDSPYQGISNGNIQVR